MADLIIHTAILTCPEQHVVPLIGHRGENVIDIALAIRYDRDMRGRIDGRHTGLDARHPPARLLYLLYLAGQPSRVRFTHQKVVYGAWNAPYLACFGRQLFYFIYDLCG